MNSTVNNAKEQLQDWTVTWQPDVSNIKNYKDSDFSTSKKTEEILCDIQRTAKSNMNAASGYSLTKASGGGSDPIGTQSGVALSGGAIYNSLAAGNKDAVENEVDTLDVCLSHPTPHSAFHYHYWSGCAVSGYGFHSTSDAPTLCKS